MDEQWFQMCLEYFEVYNSSQSIIVLLKILVDVF
jgi:hypothetical protein